MINGEEAKKLAYNNRFIDKDVTEVQHHRLVVGTIPNIFLSIHYTALHGRNEIIVTYPYVEHKKVLESLKKADFEYVFTAEDGVFATLLIAW